MKHARAISLVIFLALGAAPASAQLGGMPAGGFPPGGMTNMTPEQADAMAEQMMQQIGSQMGLDPEALRNATPEERERMLQGGADAMTERIMLQMSAPMGIDPEALRNATPEERDRMLQAGAAAMADQVTTQVEENLGMSAEEMKDLSDEEIRTRLMARLEPDAAQADPIKPRPLPSAPRRGFPDGSVSLLVDANYDAEIVYSEPPERELLIVAADLRAHEIVWRETRRTPLKERLHLLELAPDPGVLVIELIDPLTRRVIRRYRPVAAATE